MPPVYGVNEQSKITLKFAQTRQNPHNLGERNVKIEVKHSAKTNNRVLPKRNEIPETEV